MRPHSCCVGTVGCWHVRQQSSGADDRGGVSADRPQELVYCPRCDAPVLEEPGQDHFGQCAECEHVRRNRDICLPSVSGRF